MKKRSIIIGLIAAQLLAFGLIGCGSQTESFPVTKAEAREIAIEQLGVSVESTAYAVVQKAGTEKDPYYIVEVLLQGVVYRYSIDPQTGDIRKLTINDQNVLPNAQPTVPSDSANEYIGINKAKEIAYTEAGVNEADVTKSDYEMDFAYGKYLYEIEFNANGHKYEYEILADSGKIFRKNVDKITVVEPIIENESFIGTERAIQIALEAAGVKKEDAVFETVEWELKKGSPIYEVEFKTTDGEYEYHIHAVTGEVIHRLTDIEKNTAQNGENNTVSHGHITAGEAKQIAIRHAAVTEDEVRFKETELDFERGVEVYEIEFQVGRVEYEYTINAKTGEVVKAERDYDD
ncbi:MAG: hypothetical protein E7599_06800 [Ruminococcaceae bacterium]|nr:hypothetical protein [Oscillospiraceae bacterium]